MSRAQRKIAALLACAFVLITAHPSSGTQADTTVAKRFWNGHATSRLHPSNRAYGHAWTGGATSTRGRRTADDSCDLPSSGCESGRKAGIHSVILQRVIHGVADYLAN